jgi:hypothetical protein
MCGRVLVGEQKAQNCYLNSMRIMITSLLRLSGCGKLILTDKG